MGSGIRGLRTFFVSSAGSEVAAVLVVMLLVGLVTCPVALFADAQVTANGPAPVNPCIGNIIANSTTQTANQVKVSDASSSGDSLDVYTSRSGGTVERVSLPLTVQDGLLPPNLCLGTVVSDLVRSDGEVVPANQVTSWALSGNDGQRVYIYIEVSPRYGTVTQSGGYKGIVSLDDERAVGGNVPVEVHVQYPRLWRASMVCIIAAWFGFFWAWLIHLTRADIPTAGRFWLYVILQVAVLTIVAFPVLNAQILTNPDWTGDVSQFIALASLAGGGALATTPTLRALVDRAAIFMPGSSESAAVAAGKTVPAVPAGSPAAGDGGALTAPAGGDSGDGGTPATAPGGDGSSLSAPAGGDGGTTAASPAGDGGDSGALPTPQGGDGSALTMPPGGDSGDGGTPAAPQSGDGGNGGDDGAQPASPAPQGGDGGAVPAPQGGDGSALAAPQGGDGGETPALTAPPVPPVPPTPSASPEQ